MQQILVQFAIIFVLFQSIQGNIDYVNTKRHLEPESFNNGFRYHAKSLNNEASVAADASTNLPRTRKQVPSIRASTINFVSDNSDSILAIYSGEGSAVSYVLYSYIIYIAI